MKLVYSMVAALMVLPHCAQAATQAAEPWVRATVPAQKATGAFVRLTADSPARLIAARSPVAGTTEIHEMSMDAGVMKMRRLEQGLALPANAAVELKPGGYHLMLMDLKQQVKAGDTVPLTLVIETADGQRQTLELKAPARPLAAQDPHAHH